MLNKLPALENVTIYGPTNADAKGATICFNMEDLSHMQAAKYISENGVAIRGHSFFWLGMQKLHDLEDVARFCLHYFSLINEMDYAISLQTP